jgi:hypothetical protein
MDIGGVKLNFKPTLDKPAPSKLSESKEYDISFTNSAYENMKSLGVTKDKVLDLIQREFNHHTGYLSMDFNNYPMPVQNNYVVILDKTKNTLAVRAVKSLLVNEAELASINSLLTNYRRLSRYKYRDAQGQVLRTEMIRQISKSHSGMIYGLIKHYIFYKEPGFGNNQMIGDYLSYEQKIENARDISEITKYKKEADRVLPGNKAFGYTLINSARALKEINDLIADLENEFISQSAADQGIVMALENSLQHIHTAINLLFED